MRSYRNSFQYKVATGRWTLPVAILLSLAVWGSTADTWSDIGVVFSCAFIAYLLIELNTRFSLIRTRTTLPSSLFLLFYAALPFLNAGGEEGIFPPLFLLALFCLFSSYESPRAPVAVFHAYLCLGLMSFVDACYCYLLPVMYLSMCVLRSFSARTFFAGLVGICLPYWLCWGVGMYRHDTAFLHDRLQQLVAFSPMDYSGLPLNACLSWAVAVLVAGVTGVHVYRSSYKEKVQIRVMLHVLLVMEVGVHLLLLLQPSRFNSLMGVQLLLGSITAGYMFSLTFTRYTRWASAVLVAVWCLMCLMNLWMHFYSF